MDTNLTTDMRHSSDNLRQSVADGAIKAAHSSDTNYGLDDIIESPLRVAQLKVIIYNKSLNIALFYLNELFPPICERNICKNSNVRTISDNSKNWTIL